LDAPAKRYGSAPWRTGCVSRRASS
jgi:hypothetical protein